MEIYLKHGKTSRTNKLIKLAQFRRGVLETKEIQIKVKRWKQKKTSWYKREEIKENKTKAKKVKTRIPNKLKNNLGIEDIETNGNIIEVWKNPNKEIDWNNIIPERSNGKKRNPN